ncbi:UNVERIFIED_CONTAM: hypothetical protein H355_015450 [Colinus virginianus]|nr:hypothetical protein H355_015450 [Colinus virginianus]
MDFFFFVFLLLFTLNRSLPSLEMEAVFKCYSPYTTFFYGSALNSEDLKRVRMESANACLILADVCSPEPYTEDISNIMRVLSIKNLYPKTRVILQIIQSHNKTKRKHLKDKMLLGDKDYKVMTFQLSDDFADMTFIEVCRLCFVKLNLVLLGIELKFGSRGESAILINPSPQIKLQRNTMGFFIAHSLAEVKR